MTLKQQARHAGQFRKGAQVGFKCLEKNCPVRIQNARFLPK
jgi:hypothetical protein